MGYRQEGDLARMFDEAPWLECGRRIVDRSCDRMLELAVAFTPVAVVDPGEEFGRHRAPGTLKRGWRRGPVLPGDGVITGEIENTDPIAVFVNYPTRPHVIRPKADRAPATVVATRRSRGTVQDGRAHLRFIEGGRVVYAREVHHPGTHGSYFLERSLATLAAGEWQAIADEEITRTARLVSA